MIESKQYQTRAAASLSASSSRWIYHPIIPSLQTSASLPVPSPQPPPRISPFLLSAQQFLRELVALWNAYSGMPDTDVCTLRSNCGGQMFNYTWQAEQQEAAACRNKPLASVLLVRCANNNQFTPPPALIPILGVQTVGRREVKAGKLDLFVYKKQIRQLKSSK